MPLLKPGWAGSARTPASSLLGTAHTFLLGELLLDVEIEPDSPFTTDQCGTCRRCIDACPTQCIRADRTLESEHCISYQTIENKGTIPPNLRPLMGDWVFGCDVCQQVCPWNIRFASPQGSPLLQPYAENTRPVLMDELKLTSLAFNARFKGTPFLRAKRRGYLRNVAVALGNARDRRAVPALAACLQEEDEPLVRAHAAWAIGQIGGEDARASLVEARTGETSLEVLEDIINALQNLGDPLKA